MNYKFVLKIIFCLLCVIGTATARDSLNTEDFQVLDHPAKAMMEQHLLRIIDRQFYTRDSLLCSLHSRRDWEDRIRTVRDSIRSWTGPFPARTPLNTRITGTIDHEDYTIEKIIYESRPGFPVSANLYLPKDKQNIHPAVLNVIGHWLGGKAEVHVQKRSIAQAKKGFVALTIDCLGQGERQISAYKEYGKGASGMHKGIGLRAFLLDWHLFNIMAWDAIRGIDYLVSRPEVDPDRIIVTGASGGGMMTTYLLPLDNRIQNAIPVCNPSTYSYHAHLPNGSDHEQVFYGCFASGIDMRGDPLVTQIPDPLMISATLDDKSNPPRGVWELADWLDRVYASFGIPEKFEISMVDGGHGYARTQREATYKWMERWSGDDSTDFREPKIQTEPAENLNATLNRDVFALDNTITPQQLINKYAEQHRRPPVRMESKEDLFNHQSKIRKVITKILRFQPVKVPPVAEQTEVQIVDGLRISKYRIYPEEGIVLPGVMLAPAVPDKENIWQQRTEDETGWRDIRDPVYDGPIVLYLHDAGKDRLLADRAVLDSLLQRGNRIFAVDLRGYGETSPGMESSMFGYLTGNPVFGQRVWDILSCLAWLSRGEIHTDGITIWAHGITALHTAFALPYAKNVNSVILENPLLSFEALVTTPIAPYREEVLVPGVLRYFDLPELYQALAPTRITLLNPLTPEKTPASRERMNRLYSGVEEAYTLLSGAKGNWQIFTGASKMKRIQILLESS